jgi:hypothetical protein
MNQTAVNSKITITDDNFSDVETARIYRNWIAKGKAPAVQMNCDTLYGVAIIDVVDGKVTFDIPKTNNYSSVQVVIENGHGE